MYCYMVLPFGLKNAGATYQRIVNKIFKNQISRDLEVYVDDMIAKNKNVTDNDADLEETCKTLRANGMLLNPDKCVFIVIGGKCLDFLFDDRVIETNSDEIQAVLAMKLPRENK